MSRGRLPLPLSRRSRMATGRQQYQPLSDAIQPYRSPRQSSSASTAPPRTDSVRRRADGAVAAAAPDHEDSSTAGSRSTPSGRSPGPHVGTTHDSVSPSKRKRNEKDKDTSPSSSSGVRSPYARTPAKRSFLANLPRMPSPPNSTVQPDDRALYEFQWRVLHLCREFYEAASELLQATPESVISSCYLNGIPNATNPLTILNDARRACDHLLNNPSNEILGNAAVSHSPASPRSAAVSAAYATSPLLHDYFRPTSAPGNEPPTATLPGSFFSGTSVANPSSSPYSLRPVSAAGLPSIPSRAPSLSQQHMNQQQGSWTEAETQKLQNLASEHRNGSGEVDWDAVVSKFGVGRSRHQILIRATQLGLKPTSTRPSRQRQQAQYIRAVQAQQVQAQVQVTAHQQQAATITTPTLTTYSGHSHPFPVQSPVTSATTPTALWTSPHHTPYYSLPSTFQTSTTPQDQPHLTPKSESAAPFAWPPPPGPPPGAGSSGDANGGGPQGATFGYG